MADLDAAHGDKFRAAFGAGITGGSHGDIGNDVRLKITRVINIFKVSIRFVAASHKIRAGGDRIIGNNQDVFQSDGRSGAGDNPVFLDFGIGSQS